MQTESTIILGAGVTGLATGIKTGAPIFEANPYPGGICRSFAKNGYRFEVGGGHWIFGTDKPALSFLQSLSPLKRHQRASVVFFPKNYLFVPYPLQNHLSYLPEKITKKALGEIARKTNTGISLTATLADWFEANFGRTLCNLFFFPFHQLYTAGLYTKITPQNHSKTPIDKNLIIKGARGEKTPKVGYNQTFTYPEKGLSDLIEKMAKKCQVSYNKKARAIDIKKKEILFEDGEKLKYKRIISTLPLNKMVKMAKISLDEPSAPYTSVTVVNIGAKKGKKCPPYHWLYIPESRSGFYRVGFYSNIDPSFLPSKKGKERVSLYIDKAYPGGKKPKEREVKKLTRGIVKELTSWEFIDQVDIVNSGWIETAYTWSLPSSNWRKKALKALKENDIYQIGRYGRWKFQGILESIKEGLAFSVE